MAKVYRAGAVELNAACVGEKQLILVEGVRNLFSWNICEKFNLFFCFV